MHWKKSTSDNFVLSFKKVTTYGILFEIGRNKLIILLYTKSDLPWPEIRASAWSSTYKMVSAQQIQVLDNKSWVKFMLLDILANLMIFCFFKWAKHECHRLTVWRLIAINAGKSRIVSRRVVIRYKLLDTDFAIITFVLISIPMGIIISV